MRELCRRENIFARSTLQARRELCTHCPPLPLPTCCQVLQVLLERKSVPGPSCWSWENSALIALLCLCLPVARSYRSYRSYRSILQVKGELCNHCPPYPLPTCCQVLQVLLVLLVLLESKSLSVHFTDQEI